MQTIKEKMIPAFRDANGGLFQAVEKADVGSAYQDLEKQGVALMGWADPFMPDRSLPEPVAAAWLDAVRAESAPHYTAPIGDPALKAALAKKLKQQNGLTVDPERNILITPGSDSGLYFAILPFVGQGDEVLIPSPSYPNNFLDVKIMGGVPVAVELDAADGYQLSRAQLEAKYTARTRMVLLTHPNNPTTTIYNRASLQALADFVQEHDLILVVDQAFEDYTFGAECLTPAALPGMFERTVTVFSFSKGMGLSGMRVGYIVCSDQIMDSMYANAVGVIGATSTSGQKAALAALEHPEFMQEFARAYEVRRRKAYEILNCVPGVHMALPESGFLGWIDVSELGNSTEIAQYLVTHARVSLNDGVNYGPGGAGHLRIVLGVYKDDQKVIDALERIRDALLAYPPPANKFALSPFQFPLCRAKMKGSKKSGKDRREQWQRELAP